MPYLESALVTTASAGAMASIGGGRARFYLYLGWAGHSERLARRQTDHSLLVLNHGLHIVDSIAWRNVKSDGLARKSVDENLHSTTETKYQVNSGLLLNVVVTQGSAVCQLRAGENQTLLVFGNTLLVLVSSLHVVVLISFAITTGSIHVGRGSLGIAIRVSSVCRAERRVIHASTLTVLQANKQDQAQEDKKHDSHLDSSHAAAAG